VALEDRVTFLEAEIGDDDHVQGAGDSDFQSGNL